MKIDSSAFIALQNIWYDKLQDAGFKDIEERDEENNFYLLPDAHSNPYYRYNVPKELKEIKKEYYRCISEIVNSNETFFSREIDKIIMIRHAEGAKIKTIIEELHTHGMHRDRRAIRFIIRRYEMKWHLKYYSPRQLDKRGRSKT